MKLTGLPVEAAAHYMEAAAADASYAPAFYNLGVVLAEGGRSGLPDIARHVIQRIWTLVS